MTPPPARTDDAAPTDGPAGSPPGGSYDPAATTAGGLAGELARLEAQAALSFDAELRILRELGVTEGSGPLVEIGAGSGAVTRRLRAALPGLPLTAVDIDGELLAHAAGCGAETVVADGADLPLPDASAGVVLLRYVLQHLADPGTVLAEALRVLRPGGLLVATEVDASCWGLAEPSYPELAGIHGKLTQAQASAGGDRTVGRRLTRMLRDAGCADVVLRPFATTNDDHPTEAFAPHLGPGRLQPLVAAGVVTLPEFALAADRWNRFRADPDAYVMLLGFTAAGRTPAPP
ncbi:class I SAM-dependent methyltransferase [Streptomyces salinarius]|uniref:class I SAM-dependent methyltransferase n=1 Tax=Streptomyces salinarius TaxID=2762598 RepID=UPI001643FF04|nr:class I SAM-dependent methyltransferase [Streptomyces salinarius]